MTQCTARKSVEEAKYVVKKCTLREISRHCNQKPRSQNCLLQYFLGRDYVEFLVILSGKSGQYNQM